LAVFLAFGLSLGSAFLLPFRLETYIQNTSVNVSWMVLSVLVVLAVGFIDDLYTIRATYKLIGLIAAALIAYDAGVRVNYLGEAWAFPITILWLVGCANAFNLIDGMDGLASGIGALATLTILIAALSNNNRQLVILTVPLLCAILGFLRYNFNPASIFLGDSGSLAIGFTMACFGALWSQKAATLLGLTAPLVAFAIPLTDVSLAIARRFLRKQSIFAADAAHIHHRLLGRGMTVRRAALSLYAVAAVASMTSLAVTSLQQKAMGGAVVLLFGAGLLAAVQYLGYREFSVFRRLMLSNDVRQLVDTQTRVEHLAEQMAGCQTLAEAWRVLTPTLDQLHFAGVRLYLERNTLEHFAQAEIPNCWTLTIPLSGSQRVEIYAPVDSPAHFPVRALVEPLQHHLERILLTPPAVHVLTLSTAAPAATQPVESVA
jgi:UDP-GlcNAc:undecaprenyl-phosphate GlcNAc-1-phosphate transferase